MKKILLLVFVCVSVIAKAQLLSWYPDFIKDNSTPVVITADATKGNMGLKDYTPTSDVYVHIGLITSKSTSSGDWKYVKFNYGSTDAGARATYLSANKWQYTITGGLRSFFGITDATEKIQKIAILFRNGVGDKKLANTDGSDMYITIYDEGLYAFITDPLLQPLYQPLPEPIVDKKVGDVLNITAKANNATNLKIYFNGNLLTSTSAATATVSTTIAVAGNQEIKAQATNHGTTVYWTTNFVVAPANNIADLPPGVKDGINYDANNTSATLVLYAPRKKNIFVLGDFNNWQASANYLMNETPDKQRYWIKLNNLTPGVEYAYQYLIDGNLKVADYNTEKILDPDNDKYIPAATYPNLKAYPTGKTTGIVSILQTAKPAYTWKTTNFTRPDKRNLVIYELLVRDFVAAQNWQTVKDSLAYLKRLGINAIEVMPFNEFEGNNSWGYNPDFYFAPDKAYGTETALKTFINECHKQGIAVIMDMVLNHSFGQSPMVQMYFNNSTGRPATNSPWFNPVAKHAYNVGYDFNHGSQATKDFVDRVLNHWLTNYHIDGYRFDLAKGFTQAQTCDDNGGNCDVGAWGNYDASRVAIWKRIYDKQESFSANSYCILEMFADNSEEKVYSDYGMMLWGNLNYSFNQATMGYSDGWNFNGGIYTQRGWTKPGLITYQESHDEERLMFKNEQYGNSNGVYNVKDTATGLKRDAMAAAFWSMIPGPKMLWQFGEIGYDYSINTCENGTINNDCRTSPKPIKWDYYQNVNRRGLYDVYSALLRLRTTPAYLSTFTTGTINNDLSASVKWLDVSSADLKVVVIGNFDVTNQTAAVTFPNAGTWYSYLTDSATTINTATTTVSLKPGEYYVFTSKNLRNIALPVNWLSFTANKIHDKVLLKWSTANELNNDHYEIQRSINGINYTALGNVVAGKVRDIEQHYSFTDNMPFKGNNFYRLKQFDIDGKFSYSGVAQVNISDADALFSLYPNPGATAIHIETELKQVQVSVTNAAGKILFTTTLSAAAKGQQVSLPAKQLVKGLYFIKLTADKGSKTEKLVVN